MRVLIVKTSSMGDVIHTLPSLTDAVIAIPNIRFDWVIEENFAQIPSWHATVDQIIPVAIRRWKKSWFSTEIYAERKAFRQMIRIRKYDAIIDAQGLIKSAVLVTKIAYGAKHGMNWRTVREPFASLFYNYRYHITKQQHAIERIRELFSKSLNYVKSEIKGNYAIAQNFIQKEMRRNNVPYLIFLYATTRDNKKWPETNWRELIRLTRSIRVRVKLLWDTEYDLYMAKRLATGFTHVDILPKLSLKQIAEIFINSSVIVSVDTGLSNLAAALNQPNITLFGPTDPNLIGGYGKNQHRVVSPTKKMKDISVNDVFILLKAIYVSGIQNV